CHPPQTSPLSLHDALPISVSAKTRAGLDDLKKALRHAASSVAMRDGSGYFRLPIDRAFAMKGFGSVVTGTLVSGTVGAGDEVALLPAEIGRASCRGRVESGGVA